MATIKYMAPVRSMSGKIEKQQKTHCITLNSRFSDRTLFTSFTVKRNTSCTAAQNQVRALFKQAHAAALQAIGTPQTRQQLQQAFHAQEKYKTLLGYAFRVEYDKLLNA